MGSTVVSLLFYSVIYRNYKCRLRGWLDVCTSNSWVCNFFPNTIIYSPMGYTEITCMGFLVCLFGDKEYKFIAVYQPFVVHFGRN